MTTIKELCFRYMAAAYADASGGGWFPAVARQIAYSLRRRTKLGDRLKLDYVLKGRNDTGLIDQYIAAHPGETATWDVVRDDRGNYLTPSGITIPLGTIAVRREITRIRHHSADLPEEFDGGWTLTYPKAGPHDDYSGIMYIEKEGFGPMLRGSGLLRRRDLAIASSKGFSVRAARSLLDFLRTQKVPVYVAHDFDKAGIGIAAAILREIPDAIDLGLRWEDITDDRWGDVGTDLRHPDYSEAVEYVLKGKPYDPRPNLIENDALPDEIDFLCSTAIPGREFSGRRVELNALVGVEFIDWLDARLDEEGHGRAIPGDAVLADAYRRAWRMHHLNKKEAEVWAEVRDAAEAIEVPDDLVTLVTDGLADDPDRAWDDVIAEMITDLDDE